MTSPSQPRSSIGSPTDGGDSAIRDLSAVDTDSSPPPQLATAVDSTPPPSVGPPPDTEVTSDSEATPAVSATSDPASLPQQDLANVEPERTTLWLRRADQLVVGLLATAAFVLFAIDYARLSGWGAKPVEILRLPDTEYQYKLDVNRATWVEWALLDGIGEVLGKRIVEDREKNGPFRSVEDVLRVHGIGPKKLEQMRPWLEVRDTDNVADRAAFGVKRP